MYNRTSARHDGDLIMSQKETRDMFKKTDEKFQATDVRFKAKIFVKEKFQATDKKFQATDKLLTEKFKETDERFKATNKLLTEKFKETDERFKATDEKFKATDKKFKDVFGDLGGIGKSNGEIAESFFSTALGQNMQIGKVKFDFIDFNTRRKRKNIEANMILFYIITIRYLLLK